MGPPAWDTLEAVRVVHSQLEGWALAFFAMLVSLDVVIHFFGDSSGPSWVIGWPRKSWRIRAGNMRLPAFHDTLVLKSLLKSLSLASFAIAILLEIAAYPYSGKIEELTKLEAADSQKQIVSALLKAGAANERAANALSMAESEKLERLKLEAIVAPRSMTLEQQRLIAQSLQSFKGYNRAVRLLSYGLDGEAWALAAQIRSIFIAATGKDLIDGRASFISTGGFESGIQIRGPLSEREFMAALQSALTSLGKLKGVYVNGLAPQTGFTIGGNATVGGNTTFSGGGPGMVMPPIPTSGDVTIMVGVKPVPILTPRP